MHHSRKPFTRLGIGAAIVGLFMLVVGSPAQAATSPQTTASQQTAASDQTKTADLGGKKFVIATDTTFAPFEFRDGGDLVGIDMDLLNEIADRGNFEVEIQSLGFQAAVSAVTSGQADGVIAGMSITDERKQTFDFSDPYFDSGIQMAVAESNDDIKSYEDLEGETVVAKGGSEGEAEAKKLSEEYGFTVKALDQSTNLVESVKNGSAAAVFDDYPVLKYGITQGNGLKVVTDKIPGGQYGFAVKKGDNAELLQAFNNGLARMQADGSYDETLAKYLGEDSSNDEDAQPKPDEQVGFFQLFTDSMPALGKGLWNTVLITITAFIIAMVLGLIFGFMKISTSRILRGISSTFVAIFRGTPVLVWAFLFYFGLPQLTGASGNVFWAGVATLALNAGAYLTEIVRGGLQAVDPGQMEASRSLGLSWGKSMKRVVVPQAVKISTPAIINQFVITLKDSSLLLTIGFAELLYQAQQIYAANYRTTEMLIIVGIMYFVVITLLTWVANIVDKKVNK